MNTINSKKELNANFFTINERIGKTMTSRLAKVFRCFIIGLVGCYCNCVVSLEKPFAVIIPSYKNAQWVEKNLSSVFSQHYDNYRVIYIDDCSPDNTFQLACQITEKYGQQGRTTLIHNEMRCGAMANWYKAIHTCEDNEIIVQLDGDDWLAHGQVLEYLNKIYAEQDIWLTYGQFVEYPSGGIGYAYSKPFSHDVILNNSFRKVEQLPISHLRTFYAWLFKSIKLEDVFYKDDFYQMTCDKVIMACCIEMAAQHHYCVPEVLYVYNNSNQISDHRINIQLQSSLAWHVLSLPPYKQLHSSRMVDELGKSDTMSLILLSQASSFDQIFKHIQECNVQFDKIFIMYPAVTATKDKTEHTQIVFVPYSKTNCAEEFKKCLETIKSPYVLLCKSVPKDLDLVLYVKMLNKTQVDVLFALPELEDRCRDSIHEKKMVGISFEYPAYACYPKKIGSSIWSLCNDVEMWKSEALLDKQNSIVIDHSEDLIDALNRYIRDENLFCLVCDKHLMRKSTLM